MKVVVTGPLQETAAQLLKDNGCKIVQYGSRDLVREEDFLKALDGAYAHILGGDEIMSKEVINKSPSLKIISFLGVGYQRFIDAKAAKEKGVFVTNTPGANKQSVAEMAISLLCAAQRQLVYLDNSVRAGKWEEPQSLELAGKTIGIVGMGAIGSCLAKIAYRGFGMRVIYNSRSPHPEAEKEFHATYVSKEELCKEADYISLHLSYDPQNPETKNYIDEKCFACMKSHVIIVNTSRAEVIDGAALYQALHNNTIRCAAFDGYYTEPEIPTKENDPYGLIFLPTDKFIITPHNARNTKEASTKMYMMAAQNIIDIAQTGTSKYIVN